LTEWRIPKVYSTGSKLQPAAVGDAARVQWKRWMKSEGSGEAHDEEVGDHEIEGVIQQNRLPRTSIATYQASVTTEVQVIVEEEDLERDENVQPKTPRDIVWWVADRGRRQKNWTLRWTTTGEEPHMKETILVQWLKQQHPSARTIST
jgi:hypothetical protein